MPILKIKTNGIWKEITGFSPNSDDNGNGLPVVTLEDNNKILQVINGAWDVINIKDSAIAVYIDDYISSALEGDY